MSARDPKAPAVHPLAAPLSALSGPRAGLIALGVLGALFLGPLAAELVTPGFEAAKYPDATGAYEIAPALALLALILLCRPLSALLTRRADYYEDVAGDFAEAREDD